MRHIIHKAICWYLRRCGGAFHCYNYGPKGRYVKLMSEDEYANHAKLKRHLRKPPTPDEIARDIVDDWIASIGVGPSDESDAKLESAIATAVQMERISRANPPMNGSAKSG